MDAAPYAAPLLPECRGLTENSYVGLNPDRIAEMVSISLKDWQLQEIKRRQLPPLASMYLRL